MSRAADTEAAAPGTLGPGTALPNLVVIGGMKCATSSLHYYLDLHPEVQMSSPKELNFFLAADDFDPHPYISDEREIGLFGRLENWERGPGWYARHFDPDAPVRGESSVAYATPWYPGTAERIASVLPDARLIFMVRDPVERLVSQHRHYAAVGREWRPLEAAVARRNIYVERSRYASLLRPFLERFGRDRVFIGRAEDLASRRRQTMRAVFRFVGVDEAFWSPKMGRLRNRSGAKSLPYRIAERVQASRIARPLYRLPPETKWRLERMLARGHRHADEVTRIDAGLRRRLLEELEPEIAELERLTGWKLDDWRRVEAR